MTEPKRHRLCAPNGAKIFGVQQTVTAVRTIRKVTRTDSGRAEVEYDGGLVFDPLSERTEMLEGEAIFVAADGAAYLCSDLIEEPDEASDGETIH